MRYRSSRLLADSYYWGDLIGNQLKLNRDTPAYAYTSTQAPVRKTYKAGETLPPLHSYVEKYGVTWMEFYANPADYQDFKASFIPLVGSKLSTTIETPTGVTTVEQQLIDAAEANKPWYEKAVSKAVGLAVGAYVLVNLLKPKNS